MDTKLVFILLICIYAFNQCECFSKLKSKKYYNKNLNANRNLPDPQWYTQRLDHFDDSNTQTWQQVCIKMSN